MQGPGIIKTAKELLLQTAAVCDVPRCSMRLAIFFADLGGRYLPHSKCGAGISSLRMRQAETCIHRSTLQ